MPYVGLGSWRLILISYCRLPASLEISEEISRAGHETMEMSRDRTIRVIKLYAFVYYVYISVADVTSRTG